jgi:adenylate cyclase
MSLRLRITPSVGKKWDYTPAKPLIKIGRATHCDVVINDVLVSREHCRMQLLPEGWVLEDLNSANGTLVNGKRITRTVLHPGDKIRLGLSEILIEEFPEEKGLPQPPPTTKGERAASLSKGAGPAEKGAEPASRPSPPAGEEVVLPPPLPEPGPVSLTLFAPTQAPPQIVVVHPDCARIEPLLQSLEATGVLVRRASDAQKLRSLLSASPPDCLILCNAVEDAERICQEVKAHPQAGPIILLRQKDGGEKDLTLLNSGVDEILSRPDPVELKIRLRNLLELHRLRRETNQLNAQVERRVSEDLSEAERITRLKRYLSPQLVAAVLSGNEADVLKPTRQEVSIVFSDLRNFTHFTETSEPEEIMAMLSEFHTLYGEIIFQYDGTLERFAGDGVMVFFGAPVPFKDHAQRAVAMAVTARERMEGLRRRWKKLGYNLDISFGIATGFVYVGNIGFEGRMDYAAIGKTTNLAARLCAAAKGGEILINRKTLYRVEDLVEVEEIGELEVKGFSEPVTAYNVLRLKQPYIPAPVEPSTKGPF